MMDSTWIAETIICVGKKIDLYLTPNAKIKSGWIDNLWSGL